jgi:uncharacterized protein (TIGR03067 family)
MLVAALSLGCDAGSLPESKASQVDTGLAEIQGNWVVISYKVRAQFGGALTGDASRVQIKGRRVVFLRDDSVEEEWRIRVDSERRPSAIDVDARENDRTHPGVYRLNGDTLTIRVEMADHQRPKTVEKDGCGVVNLYLVLRRQKP